ncbi:MAG: YciI family protein [Solirubrobacterales bacterium]
MKYMLVLVGPEGGDEDASPEEMKAVMDQWASYSQELVDAGAFIAGEGLQESANATTIRISDEGERLATDGPFAETKEQVGGFYLVECENLDQAIEWAMKVPLRAGAVEVRPVMDYSEFGYEEPGATSTEAA